MGKVILRAIHKDSNARINVHPGEKTLGEGEVIIWETDANGIKQRANRGKGNQLSINFEAALHDAVTRWATVPRVAKADIGNNTKTADAVNNALARQTVLNKQQNALRVDLFDPYKKAMDMSIWKSTLNNIFVTGTLVWSLNGLKNTEKQAQQKVDEIRSQNRTAEAGWTDGTSAAWINQRETHKEALEQWGRDRDAWHGNLSTTMQADYEKEFIKQWGLKKNKNAQAIKKTTAIKKEDLGIFENLFDSLVREHDKTRSLKKYITQKRADGSYKYTFLAKKGSLTNLQQNPFFKGQNLKNLHPSLWNIPDKSEYGVQAPELIPPPKPDLIEEPEVPDFTVAKMALSAYLGYKLCLFGVATLTSLFSRAKANARGTNRTIVFETSSTKLMQSSRVFGNKIGQTMLLTAAQTKMQSHDLDAFIKQSVLGLKDLYIQLKNYFDTDVIKGIATSEDWRVYDFDIDLYPNAHLKSELFYVSPKVVSIENNPTTLGIRTNVGGAGDLDLRVEMEEVPNNEIGNTGQNYLKIKDIKVANGGSFKVSKSIAENPDLGLRINLEESQADIDKWFGPNHGLTGNRVDATVAIANDKIDIARQYSWMLAGHMYENILEMWRLYASKAYVIKTCYGPAGRGGNIEGLIGNWNYWQANAHAITFAGLPNNVINAESLSANLNATTPQRIKLTFDISKVGQVNIWQGTGTGESVYIDGLTRSGSSKFDTRISAKYAGQTTKTNLGTNGVVEVDFDVTAVDSEDYDPKRESGEAISGAAKGLGTSWKVYSQSSTEDVSARYSVGDIVSYPEPNRNSRTYYFCINAHDAQQSVGAAYPNNKVYPRNSRAIMGINNHWKDVITPQDGNYWEKITAADFKGTIHGNPQYITTSPQYHYQRFLEFKVNELAHFARVCAQILVGTFQLSGVKRVDTKIFRKGSGIDKYRMVDGFNNDNVDKWAEFKLSKKSEKAANSTARPVKPTLLAYLEPVVDDKGRLFDVRIISGGYGYKDGIRTGLFAGGGEVAGHEMHDIKLKFITDAKTGEIKDVQGGWTNPIAGESVPDIQKENTGVQDTDTKKYFVNQPYIVMPSLTGPKDTEMSNPVTGGKGELFGDTRLKTVTGVPVKMDDKPGSKPDWAHHEKATTITSQEVKDSIKWILSHPARETESWDGIYSLMLDYMTLWMEQVESFTYGTKKFKTSVANNSGIPSLPGSVPEDVWNVAEFVQAKTNINQAIRSAQNTAKAGASRNEILDRGDQLACQSFITCTPQFGWCQDQQFNEVSQKMAERSFASKGTFEVWHAPNKIKERMCNKKSCGAVHAYTTVPPIGQMDTNATTIPEGVPMNSNHDLCGDVEITWQLFPTANSYLAGLLGRKDGVVKSFLKWQWFESEIAVTKDILPKFHAPNATTVYELAAADHITWRLPILSFIRTKKQRISSGNAMLPEIWGNWSDSFGMGIKGKGRIQGALKFLFGGPGAIRAIAKNTVGGFLSLFGVDPDVLTGHPDFSIANFQSLSNSANKVTTTVSKSIELNGGITVGSDLDLEAGSGKTLIKEGKALYTGDKISFIPDISKYEDEILTEGGDVKYFEAEVLLINDKQYSKGAAAQTALQNTSTVGRGYQLSNEKLKLKVKVTGGLLNAANYTSGTATANQNQSSFDSWSGAVKAGSVNPTPKEAMQKVTDLKVAFWQQRLKLLGWGPYVHEYIWSNHNDVKNLHKNKGTTSQAMEAVIDKKASVKADKVSPDGIALYHQRHLMKILQGYMNDLKGEANIHPSRGHKTSSELLYENEPKNLKLADIPSVKHETGGSLTQTPYDGIDVDALQTKAGMFNNPLIKKRYLSGVCYPRVIQSGIHWQPFMYAVSGELDTDWQPWGHNHESDALINDYYTPLSFTNYINSQSKFTDTDAQGVNTTLPKYDIYYNSFFKKLRFENSTYYNKEGYDKQLAEQMDPKISQSAESETLKNQLQNYNNGAGWRYSVQEFLATDIQYHYNPSDNTQIPFIKAYAPLSLPEQPGNTVPDSLKSEIFGNPTAGKQQPVTRTEDNVFNPDPKNRVPEHTINPRHAFRGKGDWHELAKEMDEKLGEFCEYHPVVYIDDISFATMSKGYEQSGIIGYPVSTAGGADVNKTVYKGVDANGFLDDKAVPPIDLTKFAEHYVEGHLLEKDADDVKRPKWAIEKLSDGVTNKYADAWEYAYAHGLSTEGDFFVNDQSYPPLTSWYLRGVSCTNHDDALRGNGLHSVSGQYKEYTRLINKFHYTGISRKWTRTGFKDLTSDISDDLNSAHLNNGKGAKDPYFTGVGFGATQAEAEANAYAAMEKMAQHKITGAKAPYHFWSNETTYAGGQTSFTNINNETQSWAPDYSGPEGLLADCMTGIKCYESGNHRADTVTATDPSDASKTVDFNFDHSDSINIDITDLASCPGNSTWLPAYGGTCGWNLDIASTRILEAAQAGESKPLQGCLTPKLDWTNNSTNVFTLTSHNDGVSNSVVDTTTAKCNAVASMKTILDSVSGSDPYNDDASYCWSRFSGMDSVGWLPQSVCNNYGDGYFDWRKMSTGNAAGTTNTTNPWWEDKLSFSAWKKDKAGTQIHTSNSAVYSPCSYTTNSEDALLGYSAGTLAAKQDPCRVVCGTSTVSEAEASGIVKQEIEGVGGGADGFRFSDVFSNILNKSGLANYENVKCWIGAQGDTPVTCQEYVGGGQAWGYDSEYIPEDNPTGDGFDQLLAGGALDCLTTAPTETMDCPSLSSFGPYNITGIEYPHSDGYTMIQYTALDILHTWVELARVNNWYHLNKQIQDENTVGGEEVFLSDWISTGNFIDDGTAWEIMMNSATSYTNKSGQILSTVGGDGVVTLINTNDGTQYAADTTNWKRDPSTTSCNLHRADHCKGSNVGRWYTNWTPNFATLNKLNWGSAVEIALQNQFEWGTAGTQLDELSFYEQCYTGTNADGSYYFSGLSAWTAVHDPANPVDNYWKCCLEVDCDNYKANLTGIKPTLMPGLERAVVTGRYSGIKREYIVDTEMLRNRYSGVMYVSGYIPYVTGKAGWTNLGSVTRETDIDIDDSKGGTKKLDLQIVTDQAYTYHLGQDKVMTLEAERGQGRQAVSHSVAASVNNWEKENSRINKFIETGNLGRISNFSVKAADNEYHLVNFDIPEIQDNSGPVHGQGEGDLVFMGGWPLANPAWPSELPIKKNISKTADTQNLKAMIGERKCVIMVSEDDLKSAGVTLSNTEKSKRKLNATNKSKFTVKAFGSESLNEIKPIGTNGVYKPNGANGAGVLAEVFLSGGADPVMQNYINLITNSVNIVTQATHNASEADKKTVITLQGPNGNRQLDGIVYEWEGALSTCEECVAHPIEVDKADKMAKGDFRGAGYDERPAIMFGENFMVGMRHKWNMRSGDWSFEVPYTEEMSRIKVTQQNNNTAPQYITINHWTEMIWPEEEDQNKYDARLARTGYSVMPNGVNSPFPPGVGCTAKSKLDGVVDFKVGSRRAWTEIPMGGMIEVANFAPDGRDLPFFAGQPDVGAAIGQDGVYAVTGKYAYDHPAYIDVRYQNWLDENESKGDASKGLEAYYKAIKDKGYTTEGLGNNTANNHIIIDSNTSVERNAELDLEDAPATILAPFFGEKKANIVDRDQRTSDGSNTNTI